MTASTKNWKLSPSDFAFLWEECKRCFYLKVARGFYRPRTPFPGIFSVIDQVDERVLQREAKFGDFGDVCRREW